MGRAGALATRGCHAAVWWGAQRSRRTALLRQWAVGLQQQAADPVQVARAGAHASTHTMCTATLRHAPRKWGSTSTAASRVLAAGAQHGHHV